MGKTTTAAEFVLTANNRTGVAFGQLGASFRQAKADAEKYSAAAGRAARGPAGGLGGRSGGGLGMMGGMGRFLAPAALFAGVRNVMQSGDEIGDQADSMQVSAETFQTLKVLARDTSVSVGGLGKAFASLNEKKVEALADDTSAAAEAFQKLNLSKPLFAMNTEELFEAVAATMRSTTSTAAELAAAQDLLGQSATKLMPVYQALAGTSLAELNKQLIESGRIIDEHGIKKISEMESKYQAAWDKIKTFGGQKLIGAVEVAGNIKENAPRLEKNPGRLLNEAGEYYQNKGRDLTESGGYLTSKLGTLLKASGLALSDFGKFASPREQMAANWGGFARNQVEGPQALAAQEPPANKVNWYGMGEPGIPKANGPIEVKPDNRRLETIMEQAARSLQAIERKPAGSPWK